MAYFWCVWLLRKVEIIKSIALSPTSRQDAVALKWRGRCLLVTRGRLIGPGNDDDDYDGDDDYGGDDVEPDDEDYGGFDDHNHH